MSDELTPGPNKCKIIVFGAKEPNTIMVPRLPISVRNNCQSGAWFIGDKCYGQNVSMRIIKFQKYYGDLGMTQKTTWGQLWFVAESGELPKDVVMVTYIKTRSLDAFMRTITEVQARGIEPGIGVFIPKFVKHTGQKDGQVTNYYSLDWEWEEKNDIETLQRLSAVLLDPESQALMIDFWGTRRMLRIDAMVPEELQNITNSDNAWDSENEDKPLPFDPDGF